MDPSECACRGTGWIFGREEGGRSVEPCTEHQGRYDIGTAGELQHFGHAGVCGECGRTLPRHMRDCSRAEGTCLPVGGHCQLDCRGVVHASLPNRCPSGTCAVTDELFVAKPPLVYVGATYGCPEGRCARRAIHPGDKVIRLVID
jgi:hypothetical protein